jgi:hypothetical protein
MSSNIDFDSIIASLSKLKIPKNIDELLESSKSDKIVFGGLTGKI